MLPCFSDARSIGGLGHFALLWSKALGAETYAISHSESKKQVAVEKLGLKPENFIVSHDVDEMKKQLGGKLDIIIVTANHVSLRPESSDT